MIRTLSQGHPIDRVRDITADALEVVATGLAFLFVGLFFVFMFGGGVYRTECTLQNGLHTKGWELGGFPPYLWSAGQNCEETTLTRYVLGEVGIMDEIDK